MQEKFLSEEEIKTELNDYIYKVNIRYAMLINGSWGSGKTYFVKNYIEELETEYKKNKNLSDKKMKKPIYVSLYGLNNISEIKSKIALCLIRNEKAKKLLPFLDVGIEIGTDFISKNTFIQSSDSKLSKIIGALYKIDNLIIFFDDLERCSISVNSILGYINELVEHNNIKVIIVADESKIGKISYESNIELKYMVALSEKIKFKDEKDDNIFKNIDNTSEQSLKITKDEIKQRAKNIFSENNFYSEIKEKLIGKIIYYRADINNIYDVFVGEIITNTNARSTAINNKEIFLKQLEDNNHYNLRTIQFVFQSFDRLVAETINLIDWGDVQDTYLKDLFSYCTIKSLLIKKGEIFYNWEKEQEFGTVYLGNKLSDYIYKNFAVGFKFVDDYLLNSYLKRNKLDTILNNYKKAILNEMSNPEDPLYKLKTWWLFSEQELKLLLDELIKKIENNEYELELYSKIVNFLSRVEEMNVCKSKIKIAINKLENNIKNDVVRGNYNEDRLFDGTKTASELYKRNIEKIRRLVELKEAQNVKTEFYSIYNSDEWGKNLKDYCKSNDSKFLNEKRFAYILDKDLILKNIKSKNIENVYDFWYTLQNTYHFSNIKSYYENDKSELIELKNALEKIKGIDNVKKFVVKSIVLFLEEVISNL